jgi:hypothetical protein
MAVNPFVNHWPVRGKRVPEDRAVTARARLSADRTAARRKTAAPAASSSSKRSSAKQRRAAPEATANNSKKQVLQLDANQ